MKREWKNNNNALGERVSGGERVFFFFFCFVVVLWENVE